MTKEDEQSKCPYCGSTDVRVSRLRSKQNFFNRLRYTPYRCRSCRQHYWAPNRQFKKVLLTGLTVGVATIIALGVFYQFIRMSNSYHSPAVENVKFLKKLELARQGDAEAQYQLGLMYRKGDGVTPMRSEAIKWFTGAATLGHAKAQLELAFTYSGYSGDDTMLDLKQASYWLQQAAEQGEVEAQYMLGNMYADGRGVIQDHMQAAKWLKRAANAGHLDAMYRLGMMYVAGNGVTKDFTEAYVWFNLAAAEGNQTAMIAREEVVKLLTADQLAQGQARSRSWKPSNEHSSPQQDKRNE